MTIPYVGYCLGSDKEPLAGSVEDHQDGTATGLCGTCSGRFALDGGLLTQHETAPDEERETPTHSG